MMAEHANTIVIQLMNRLLSARMIRRSTTEISSLGPALLPCTLGAAVCGFSSACGTSNAIESCRFGKLERLDASSTNTAP